MVDVQPPRYLQHKGFVLTYTSTPFNSSMFSTQIFVPAQIHYSGAMHEAMLRFLNGSIEYDSTKQRSGDEQINQRM